MSKSLNSSKSSIIKNDLLKSFNSLTKKTIEEKIDNRYTNDYPSTKWAIKYLHVNSKLSNYYKKNNFKSSNDEYPYDYDK